MARDHARTNIAIWGSAEFRALTPPAQHLYFVLTTSATLNYAGVADWRPRRLAALAGGWTEHAINQAAHELSAKRVIIIDDTTEEVLIRKWMKHDGLIDQPRMAVSVTKAFASVSSMTIRGVIVCELNKLRVENPKLRGWGQDKLLAILDEPEIDPANTPIYGQTEVQLGANQSSFCPSDSVDLGQTELQLGPNQTSATNTPSTTPSPTPSSKLHTPRGQRREYPPEFEQFWTAYPKTADKPAAYKAWTKAITRETPDTITAAAQAYRDDPNRDPAYTKNASTWLNNDAWANPPLPPRHQTSPGLTKEQTNLAILQQFVNDDPPPYQELTS